MDRKERFIVKNKAAFKKRYGADWERVLYATANKQFKEEHGAGEWGTNKLTDKYKNDTPGQEDAKVRTKKVVLKRKRESTRQLLRLVRRIPTSLMLERRHTRRRLNDTNSISQRRSAIVSSIFATIPV
jgi:hypothetical protein